MNTADNTSREVDWFSVQQHVEPLLTEVGSWPVVGTIPWRYLPTDDPAKLAAIFDAARQRALWMNTRQEAMVQASHDVAEAVDCQSIARGVLRQEWRRTAGVYIPQEVA